jgi:DHA1 family tetracycline resistance protein-like MFS transporter
VHLPGIAFLIAAVLLAFGWLIAWRHARTPAGAPAAVPTATEVAGG